MKYVFACRHLKSASVALTVVCLTLFSISAAAQKRRTVPARQNQKASTPRRLLSATAIVVDERLAVLRYEPSLYSIPLQRMRAGRTMQIISSQEADGVKFYRVSLPPEKSGWVQSDAIVVTNDNNEDARLVKLIRSSNGFDQIERAAIFLENFPKSPLRPAVLLLLGDVAEEASQKLTREATRRLNDGEMQASGAKTHSFYLNYSGLDRFLKLGIGFIFNQNKKEFHYNGAGWREIVEKHKNSSEAIEAQKRLNSLAEKMK